MECCLMGAVECYLFDGRVTAGGSHGMLFV